MYIDGPMGNGKRAQQKNKSKRVALSGTARFFYTVTMGWKNTGGLTATVQCAG